MTWLDKLEAKARAVDAIGDRWFRIDELADLLMRADLSGNPETDAEFIAAANPATVLRLVELLRELRDTLAGHATCDPAGCFTRRMLDKLERGEP